MAGKRAQGRNPRESFEALSGLFAGFAHEVRNPLSTIGLHLALIKEDFEGAQTPRDQRTYKRISTVEGEVKRLQVILDEFLHFVRKPLLKKRPVEVNTMLEQLCEFMRPEVESKGIDLRCYPGEDVGLFDMDPDMFRAVLVNLIRNAFQACDKGDEILVSSRREGNQILLRVIDTGPGMDAETRERAFSPYYSTKKNGTGLGLPIARRIVEEHGGTMHMSSETDKGTQFTLALPTQRLLASKEED